MTIIIVRLVNRIIAHLSRLGLSNHWRLIVHLWILKLINLGKIIVFSLSRLGLVNLWNIIVAHLSRQGLSNIWRLIVQLNRIRPEFNN